jgi:DNA-directed RNA polymerase sigma subunit (sigma70/sigma32)
MAFLEKMKDVANKTAESAKHATAVGKGKFEDAKLSKRINDLCREIGELVVGQRRNDAPADAAAQIDAKVAEVGDIEQQIEEHAASLEKPGGNGSAGSAPGAEAAS